jgi:hypothetical protein
MKHIHTFEGFLNEATGSDVDYTYIVDLIKGADNDRNMSIFYDSYHNGIKIGGVTYSKGDLVKVFNQPVGSSGDIVAAFYKAAKDPETTKREVEKIAKEKFGPYKLSVSTEKGFENEVIVKYSPRF